MYLVLQSWLPLSVDCKTKVLVGASSGKPCLQVVILKPNTSRQLGFGIDFDVDALLVPRTVFLPIKFIVSQSVETMQSFGKHGSRKRSLYVFTFVGRFSIEHQTCARQQPMTQAHKISNRTITIWQQPSHCLKTYLHFSMKHI